MQTVFNSQGCKRSSSMDGCFRPNSFRGRLDSGVRRVKRLFVVKKNKVCGFILFNILDRFGGYVVTP